MTFLDPTSGLIGAAIAGPILLSFYFLRLRRRPLRVSSTLLWDQALKDFQVNVPFRWIKISLLLLLQMLALAGLLMALARPVVEGPAQVSDRVVIVIDQSASMSARDGEPAGNGSDVAVTRLDEARRKAVDFAQSLGRSSGTSGQRPMVQVVSSAAQARVRCPFTSDLGEVVEAILLIEPTDQPGGCDEALKLLSAAQAATDVQVEAAEVVVFTDEPGATERVGALKGRAIVVGGSPRIGDETINLGIVTMNARRDTVRPETIRIFARVQSTAAKSVSASVRLLVDGVIAESRRVNVARTPADLPLTFSTDHRDACSIVLTIDGDDLLSADNVCALRVGAAITPSIVMVAPSREGKPDPDPFLLGVMESVAPRAVRLMTAEGYEAEIDSARTDGRSRWTTSTGPDVNLMVFDRVEPSGLPPRPSLSFGAGIPIDGLRLSPLAGGDLNATNVSRFTSWKRTHPLLSYVGLDPIIIAPAPPGIVGSSDVAGTNASPDTSVVALGYGVTSSGKEGILMALQERRAGVAGSDERYGRPLHVVTSFALARSNWGPDTSFPIFIANAVDQLVGIGQAASGIAWTTAEPVLVTTSKDARQVVATDTDGRVFRRIEIPDGHGSLPLRLGIFERCGVYQLTGSEETVACVNLQSSRETLLGGQLAGPGVDVPLGEAGKVGASVVSGARSGQQEVWHWFLLGAFALATLEWVIYARGVRS